jgi:hypothetical protein
MPTENVHVWLDKEANATADLVSVKQGIVEERANDCLIVDIATPGTVRI